MGEQVCVGSRSTSEGYVYKFIVCVRCGCICQGYLVQFSDPGVSFCRNITCDFPLSKVVGQCLVKPVPFWCIMFLKTVAG